MKFLHKLLLTGLLLFCWNSNGQVGIGTTSPKGQLDVSSTNLGLVVPRVAKVEDVSDGGGNEAVNGTVVYDISRNKICYKANSKWICIGTDNLGNSTSEAVGGFSETSSYTYVKASNTFSDDQFGFSVSINSTGEIIAIGAPNEDSNATGINGDESNNSATDSGAVYVFVKSGDIWIQEAYIKASNTDGGDKFGHRVSLSGDGSKLAVGAKWESSAATGINGDESDNSALQSGAVYVFNNDGSGWQQEAYIKASNTDALDLFSLGGLCLNENGSILVVGAIYESSNATGINGNQVDNNGSLSGAVYVFNNNGGGWIQEAYIKASNSNGGDEFGYSIGLSYDGQTFVVGARSERSNATGINGNQSNNSFSSAGAAYVFVKNGSNWIQEAYIKASNTGVFDLFGSSMSISGDGQIFAVGALDEDSNATGINGDQSDVFGSNGGSGSGAVYVFKKNGSNWIQDAYIKASNTNPIDVFGFSSALNYDGTKLVEGAIFEDANATYIGGNHLDNSTSNSGAVYSFKQINGNWSQEAYIKASNTGLLDSFGQSVSLDGLGKILVVGAIGEDSNATGVGGDQTNNNEAASGAVYIIE